MNPRLRTLWDILIGGGLLALAVYVGERNAVIEQHSRDIQQLRQDRGAVKISIEAAERLSCLESRVEGCKR